MVNTLHDLQSVIEKGGGETKESAIYDTKSNTCVIRTEVQGTIDGNLSAEIGNNLSPLLDNKIAFIKGSKVSYVERKSQRGPRARKANLFV